jgi:hypothetical protein
VGIQPGLYRRHEAVLRFFFAVLVISLDHCFASVE